MSQANRSPRQTPPANVEQIQLRIEQENAHRQQDYHQLIDNLESLAGRMIDEGAYVQGYHYMDRAFMYKLGISLESIFSKLSTMQEQIDLRPSNPMFQPLDAKSSKALHFIIAVLNFVRLHPVITIICLLLVLEIMVLLAFMVLGLVINTLGAA